VHRSKFWILIFLCVIYWLGLLGCQSYRPQGTTVQIERVLSGQTIEWTDKTKQPTAIQKIRLIGVQSPDWRQQPWSGEAKVGLEKILGLEAGTQSQPVVLEFDLEREDGYGRGLAYVWKDDILVNEQLVKQGYVLAASRSPNTKYEQRLAYAQDYARVMGLGIWQPDRPMRQTPAEFQRQK
jgi:micrococcal nuclease